MNKKYILLISVLFTNLVFSADFKFGYVDVAKIFMTSKPSVAIKNHLTAKFNPEQKELKKLSDDLIKQQNQMQEIAKKVPSIDKLSATDKATLEKLNAKYQKDQFAFQQKAGAFQQTAQRAQDVASALVLDKTNNILKEISEKGGFDLVLTSQQLVFAKPKYDLTDQVIEELNKVNSAELLKQVEKAEKQQSALKNSPLANPVKGDSGSPKSQPDPKDSK